jgi:hypothetical protein
MAADPIPLPSRRGRLRDLLAWALLALATLVMLWPLGLSNRVLAGIDALTYFTPYWAYRMAELRGGHLPLWNPYLFLGAPFLANPQAAVLYPFHWPLSWLEPAQALIWSAIVHVWLAAGFAYTLARRSLGQTRPAAWLAGAVFGFGGFTLARVENINQLNTLAWLPASLWLLDEITNATEWRVRIRWGCALAAVLALQTLAGHTQTLFVNGGGMALWAVGREGRRVRDWGLRIGGLGVGLGGGALLSAAQLLPTLELNGLGLRTGGLPYRQAVSFSLRPALLHRTFLPPYAGGLAQAFGSEGYAEFAGWVSVTGMALAGIAAARWWGERHKAQNEKRRLQTANGRLQMADGRLQLINEDLQFSVCDLRFVALLILAATGAFLALGAYNPLYYVLWRFAPGFDLFRAPARWLALYAMGMAGLAGLGLDGLINFVLRGAALSARRRAMASRLVYLSPCLLVLAELWLGARALPFTQATAPAALSLRNAPAALLAATTDQPAAGRDRFLSLSDIRYDPGDLAELRALQADRLDPEAIERLVRGAKQMEVLAPNLPLLLRLPAADGYDGGALPLNDYVELQSLFLPPNALLPDGRLREQLRQIPDGRLLDLTGARYVITDKQNDLWAGDVYYDLEQAARLRPGETLTLDLADYPPFSATHLGIISHVTWEVKDSAAVATLHLDGMRDGAGSAGQDVSIAAPGDTEWGGSQRVLTPESPLRAARIWPAWMGAPGRDYLVVKPLSESCPSNRYCPFTPTRIVLQAHPANPGDLVLRGLTLIDRRTAAHQSVTISARGDFRRIQSGDVKVYERQSAPGRAWLVHGLEPVADDRAALERLADPAFDPRTAAVITGGAQSRPAAAAQPGEHLTTLAWEAERIVLRAEVSTPGMLVLADPFYPGWQATVDGAPAAIQRVNFMFRGVLLAPGRHEVVFAYEPRSWRWGLAISASALGLLLTALIALGLPRLALPLHRVAAQDQAHGHQNPK